MIFSIYKSVINKSILNEYLNFLLLRFISISERVRQIQEKLEEFIQALNKEK